MPRQRSKSVPKLRMWGLPSTRKVTSQTMETKKDKAQKRSALKQKLLDEIKRLKDLDK
jgi:hypothetical protein